ncbi:hypothetical protein HanIR_Chr08g0349881 [Helianthus annuus]|nr:hypothetical protein HanIR_Chr08g0349881 [Helianthus annuus]
MTSYSLSGCKPKSCDVLQFRLHIVITKLVLGCGREEKKVVLLGLI